MSNSDLFYRLLCTLRGCPNAVADVKGSPEFPSICGKVRFYQSAKGVLVAAGISSLPSDMQECGRAVFGFHIHSGSACEGDSTDPFADAGSHFDPEGCEHPYHAGDMPPLFLADGNAFSVFLTDRFRVKDILGHVVIVHSMPDDFTSQPAGNSGDKIACGKIRPMRPIR